MAASSTSKSSTGKGLAVAVAVATDDAQQLLFNNIHKLSKKIKDVDESGSHKKAVEMMKDEKGWMVLGTRAIDCSYDCKMLDMGRDLFEIGVGGKPFEGAKEWSELRCYELQLEIMLQKVRCKQTKFLLKLMKEEESMQKKKGNNSGDIHINHPGAWVLAAARALDSFREQRMLVAGDERFRRHGGDWWLELRRREVMILSMLREVRCTQIRLILRILH